MFKKKRQEFETLNQGLWEGKKEIEDLKKELKKASDTKKITSLAGQVEDSETTFEKMSKKLQLIVRELKDMGTTGKNLERTIKDERKNLEALEKDIKRTGGQISELQAWEKQLKSLDKGINREGLRAFTIFDEVANLPNTPKLDK
jgi:chromosome segregation ATPase